MSVVDLDPMPRFSFWDCVILSLAAVVVVACAVLVAYAIATGRI